LSFAFDTVAHQALFNVYSIGCYLFRSSTVYEEFNNLFYQIMKPGFHEILVATHRFSITLKEELLTETLMPWVPYEGGLDRSIMTLPSRFKVETIPQDDPISGTIRMGLFTVLRNGDDYQTPVVLPPRVVTYGIIVALLKRSTPLITAPNPVASS
jgi:hypothetical protein